MAEKLKCKLNGRLSEYEVLDKFKKLRQEQRLLLSELVNAEEALQEKKIVEAALVNAENSKKCFYNMDGTLIQSTPSAIITILLEEKNEVQNDIDRLNRELNEKTKELFEHQRDYNIRVNAKELSAPVRRFLNEF